MIVDDSIFARKLLSDILSKNGYKKIDEAKDGIELLEKYEIDKPDLILLDMIMPKLDGMRVLNKIIELDSEVKVIVISAVGQEKIINKALEMGAKEYIVKPINERSVMDVISRVLA